MAGRLPSGLAAGEECAWELPLADAEADAREDADDAVCREQRVPPAQWSVRPEDQPRYVHGVSPWLRLAVQPVLAAAANKMRAIGAKGLIDLPPSLPWLAHGDGWVQTFVGSAGVLTSLDSHRFDGLRGGAVH